MSVVRTLQTVRHLVDEHRRMPAERMPINGARVAALAASVNLLAADYTALVGVDRLGPPVDQGATREDRKAASAAEADDADAGEEDGDLVEGDLVEQSEEIEVAGPDDDDDGDYLARLKCATITLPDSGAVGISRMAEEVSSVTRVMHANIERVMERGERLDRLMDRSGTLEATQFSKAVTPAKGKSKWFGSVSAPGRRAPAPAVSARSAAVPKLAEDTGVAGGATERFTNLSSVVRVGTLQNQSHAVGAGDVYDDVDEVVEQACDFFGVEECCATDRVVSKSLVVDIDHDQIQLASAKGGGVSAGRLLGGLAAAAKAAVVGIAGALRPAAFASASAPSPSAGSLRTMSNKSSRRSFASLGVTGPTGDDAAAAAAMLRASRTPEEIVGAILAFATAGGLFRCDPALWKLLLEQNAALAVGHEHGGLLSPTTPEAMTRLVLATLREIFAALEPMYRRAVAKAEEALNDAAEDAKDAEDEPVVGRPAALHSAAIVSDTVAMDTVAVDTVVSDTLVSV
jgi:hypothetical protein